MKNSSCGFAVLKNSITASFARSILLLMLPLESKITPNDTGASSLEKVRICCDAFPSKSWKFFFVQSRHQPVHGIGNRNRNQNQVHVYFQGTHMRTHSCRRGHKIRLGRLGWLFHFARQNVHVVHVGLCGRGDTQARGREQGRPERNHSRMEFTMERRIWRRLGWRRIPGETGQPFRTTAIG